MIDLKHRFAGLSRLLTTVVVLALIVAGVVLLTSGGQKHYLTVDFPQANSLYKGSDVRILGVPVGQVESLKPLGEVVQVKLSYDSKYKLPEDVKAAIVSPSIVGDRFVQLSPAYRGGAVLPDNAKLGAKRSAVPVELDQVYSSLSELSTALGPRGANKNGSLSRVIDNGARTLDGQGTQINETIKNFSKLSSTLSDNKDALFGSLDDVERFVSTLKKNDSEVRTFNDSTAKVSQVLAGERQDLAGTLKSLSLALDDVKTFVSDNRSVLRGNVDDLASITEVLAANQKNIEQILVSAPTALSNVSLAYNAKYGTLDNRANLLQVLTGGLTDPATLLCTLLGQSPSGAVCGKITGLLGGASGGALAGAAKPPVVSNPGRPGVSGSSLSGAATGSTPPGELVDDSLRDMLVVKP